MTVEEYAVDLYLPYLVDIKGAKGSTLASYQSMFNNYIFPELGFKILEEVESKDILQFMTSLKGKSAKYRRNILLLLQGMFNHAIEEDVLSSSPIKRHHKPKIQRKEKPVWTLEQVRAIIDAIPEVYRSVFVIAAYTGLRIGEILALKWEDIDLRERKIHIQHSLWRKTLQSPKNEASQRFRPFGDELARVLYNMKRGRELKPSDFLFTKNGKPLCPDTLRRDVLYPALASLGIPRSERASGFHAFRHAFGSLVLSASGNLKLVQKLMGHASISTTANIYAHIYDEDEKRAVREVETRLSFGKPNEGDSERLSVAGVGFEPTTFGL